MRIPLRPTLLFFNAYGLSLIAHESAHAFAAYSLGIRSTLFHYYATPEFTSFDPPPRILVAIAGPLFSLVLGLASWLAYRMTSQQAKLPWLYLAILGISVFLGNLSSTLFSGDFWAVAVLLNAAPAIRLAITLTGLVLSCVFLYAMGRELAKWAPPDASRTSAMVHMAILPALLGTALVILAFLPLPARSITAWITAAFYWLFTAAGVFRASKSANPGGDLRIRPIDCVVALSVVAIVRVLAHGVRLAP